MRNYTGHRFGRLVALARESGGRWRCRCDCGAARTVPTRQLTSGRTRSCGCLRQDTTRARMTVHGEGSSRSTRRRSAEFVSWANMIQRCTDPKSTSYKKYGGRGIAVCARWLGRDGFRNFRADMGQKPTPSHSIDRFPDKDGDYTPTNCRWATPVEQAINRRPRAAQRKRHAIAA